jgi:hypothetical protein
VISAIALFSHKCTRRLQERRARYYRRCGSTLGVHGALQFAECRLDSFSKFSLIQAAYRVFDDQQFGVGIPGLSLRAYKWQEGFGNDDIGLYAAIF